MSSPRSDSRWKLIDSDSNEFPLVHGSLQIMDDTFPVEVEIIERSYTDGGIVPGETRGESKELAFRVDINRLLESGYRNVVNDMFYYIRKVVKIQDTINNIETDVRCVEKSITYDQGGFFHGSIVNFTLKQIIPFWWDINYIEISEFESGSNILSINNDGYYDAWPIFILKTNIEIPKFLIKELNSGYGIGIGDLQFGKTNLDTYVIDCENGECLLGSSETGGILRNTRILQGTNFFPLRRRINDLQVFTWLNRDVDFTCKYKRRYFI